MNELYRIYRPTNLSEVVGQPQAVNVLAEAHKANAVPHALLFTGPSGCGKTTLARILQKMLDCSDEDFNEKNCADFRGIDMVRDIRSQMMLCPLGGKVRIWLIDECHQLSKDAQNALLKMLEDTPKHVHFMLATTDPEKLLSTIRTRCTEIRVKPMSEKDLRTLLLEVLDLERAKVSEEVIDRIIEHSEASARKALVLLGAVINLRSEQEQLDAIVSTDGKAKAIELARALMSPKSQWSQVAGIIKTLDDDPEAVRHLVLAYASAILLNSGNERAFVVIDVFQHPFYDSKKAGLVAACYAIVQPNRR